MGSNVKTAAVVRYRKFVTCALLLGAQISLALPSLAQGFSQPKNYRPSTTRIQEWNQPGQEGSFHTGVQEWNQRRTVDGHPPLPTEPPAGSQMQTYQAPVASKKPVTASSGISASKSTRRSSGSTVGTSGSVTGGAIPISKIYQAPDTRAAAAAAKSGPVPPGSAAERKQKALEAYREAQRNLEKARIEEYYEERAKREIEVGKLKSRQIINNAPPQRTQVWTRSDDDGYIPLSERIPGYTPYSMRESQRTGNLGNSTAVVKPYAEGINTSPALEAARMQEQIAQERADAYRAQAREKTALIDQSMSNLKSQMRNSNGQGAAKLQNEGSNLYVRNYSGTKTK